jgi:hypothetical protein
MGSQPHTIPIMRTIKHYEVNSYNEKLFPLFMNIIYNQSIVKITVILKMKWGSQPDSIAYLLPAKKKSLSVRAWKFTLNNVLLEKKSLLMHSNQSYSCM